MVIIVNIMVSITDDSVITYDEIIYVERKM